MIEAAKFFFMAGTWLLALGCVFVTGFCAGAVWASYRKPKAEERPGTTEDAARRVA